MPNQIGRTIRQKRHPKGHISMLGTNFLHVRHPWVTAWWSAAFPGFGHIMLGRYIEGFVLVALEILINLQGHVNTAILYSFTGRFALAKVILVKEWALLYAAVFVYGIWSCYHSTIELNQLSLIADQEGSFTPPVIIGELEINSLGRKKPWTAVFWSLLFPGLGHLYARRLPAGFFFIAFVLTTGHFASLMPAIYYTATGMFSQAITVIDPEWLLFLPCVYTFAAYDSYVNTVETNKFFIQEQARFLRKNYQDARFEMPV